jgi:hypothetical protein
MKYRKSKKTEIISFINKKLIEIIYDNLDSLKEGDFKVRPGYGYDKFYLNRVDGSYDMSIQGLIHYLLYEELIYRDILNLDQYAKCRLVIQNHPESIYYPDDNSADDIKVRELLDFIYSYSIFSIGHFMISIGLDVSQDFKDYLDLFKS